MKGGLILLKKIVLAIVMAIVLVCVVGTGFYYWYKPGAANTEKKIETIIVDKNMTGREIGQMLEERELIPSQLLFRIALRLTGTMDRLQKGYYQIPHDVTMAELIELLQKGDVKSLNITVPEGYTVKEIGHLLAQENLMTEESFLNAARTYAPYMYVYGPQPVLYRMEGFLFPSTYSVPITSSPEDLLEQMAKEMNKQLTSEMRKEIEGQGMTIFEFLTLASLVEKEAQVEEDRPIIAAIFKKRLELHMPLQSCASVQYLLPVHKAILSYEDTQIDSPYNTYIHTGLPPGPIGNPGLAAMKAVLHAQPTDLLFFVADKEGKHHFSKTYEEHMALVESIYGNE